MFRTFLKNCEKDTSFFFQNFPKEIHRIANFRSGADRIPQYLETHCNILDDKTYIPLFLDDEIDDKGVWVDYKKCIYAGKFKGKHFCVKVVEKCCKIYSLFSKIFWDFLVFSWISYFF